MLNAKDFSFAEHQLIMEMHKHYMANKEIAQIFKKPLAVIENVIKGPEKDRRHKAVSYPIDLTLMTNNKRADNNIKSEESKAFKKSHTLNENVNNALKENAQIKALQYSSNISEMANNNNRIKIYSKSTKSNMLLQSSMKASKDKRGVQVNVHSSNPLSKENNKKIVSVKKVRFNVNTQISADQYNKCPPLLKFEAPLPHQGNNGKQKYCNKSQVKKCSPL